jgi:DNA-binding MarR family transcriptional regulator
MISRENVLELETRRMVYNHILEHPGLHVRQLERELKIPFGTLKYHLKFLKKRDLLIIESKDRFTRYFVKEKIGSKDKKVLSLIRRDSYRKIILFMLMMVLSTRSEISKSLQKHPNTIAYHLEKLLENEIIEHVPVKNGEIELIHEDNRRIVEYSYISNENVYKLKDPARVYDLFITYKSQLKDEKDAIELMEEAVRYKDKYGRPARTKRKSQEDKTEILLDALMDIFPHPYHV